MSVTCPPHCVLWFQMLPITYPIVCILHDNEINMSQNPLRSATYPLLGLARSSLLRNGVIGLIHLIVSVISAFEVRSIPRGGVCASVSKPASPHDPVRPPITETGETFGYVFDNPASDGYRTTLLLLILQGLVSFGIIEYKLRSGGIDQYSTPCGRYDFSRSVSSLMGQLRTNLYHSPHF